MNRKKTRPTPVGDIFCRAAGPGEGVIEVARIVPQQYKERPPPDPLVVRSLLAVAPITLAARKAKPTWPAAK